MSDAPLSPKQDEPRWWMRILEGAQRSRSYPIVVGLLAAISAGSGLYPFGPVLIAAIVIAPRRWLWVYLASCIGAVVGVLVLAGMVELYGISVVDSMFPGLEHRSDWLRYTHWISHYGWVALMAFAALPIPQMPVLLLSALSHINLILIAVAVLIGKLIKYGIYVVVTLAALKGIEARKP
jgi:membrane protein YqaA with SNARE-associated domain